MVMPGLSGIRLAERLRDKWPRLKVLFMSGYGRLEEETRFDPAEGTAFLPKPFSPEALVAKVRDSLGEGGRISDASGPIPLRL